MSIELPSKNHTDFTKKLRLLQKNGDFTESEKEELYIRWESSYHKYLKRKHFLSKVNKKSQP